MAIDISGINNQMIQNINNTVKETADQNAFEAILNEAVEKKDTEKLKKACQEFEGYFLQQVFKEMRKTVPESGLLEKSQGREIFEDMFYEEHSKNISKGKGIGLSEMLYRQLSKNITDL